MSRQILEYICFLITSSIARWVAVGVIMVYLNAIYLYPHPTLSMAPFRKTRME